MEQGKDYRIGEEALHGGDRGWIAPGLTKVSLNSDASVFLQRMSAAASRCLSSFWNLPMAFIDRIKVLHALLRASAPTSIRLVPPRRVSAAADTAVSNPGTVDGPGTDPHDPVIAGAGLDLVSG